MNNPSPPIARRVFALIAIAWITLFALSAAQADTAEAPPKHAAIVSGYPDPDSSLYEFALRKQHAKVDTFDSTWLPLAEYPKYNVVVLTGNLARAKVSPANYSEDDLKLLTTYLKNGGTLILTAGSLDIFHTPAGGAFLAQLYGKATDNKDKSMTILEPKHPWIAALAAESDVTWLTSIGQPIIASQGDHLIGNAGGRAMLWRLQAGKGQVIYVGWEFSRFLPGGRNLKSTVEDERLYELQFGVLTNIAKDVLEMVK